MSLYKQLTFIITIFLIFILSIILFLVINYNKVQFENQSSFNTKNNASFLGLTISKNISLEDKSTIEGMFSSLLDNSFYEYIALYDENSKEIVKTVNLHENKEFPNWFVNLFNFENITASADIMKGWLNSGYIEIKADSNYVKSQLWLTFKRILQIFLISAIIFLVILYFLINKLLKPLKKLDLQAKAIDNNEFIIENIEPKTQEFKSVVYAMNKTILKLKNVFDEDLEILYKYNKLSFTDAQTKLGNREYMTLKLDMFLKSSFGLLVFFEIKNETELKKKIGFFKYKDFVEFIITSINNSFDNKNKVFSKLNSETMAILLSGSFYIQIEKEIKELQSKIKAYILENNLDKEFDIDFAFGVSNYRQNEKQAEVLSRTNQALVDAFLQENRVSYIKTDKAFDNQRIKNIVKDLEDSQKIDLSFDSEVNMVLLENNETIVKEYVLAFEDIQGKIYTQEFTLANLKDEYLISFEKMIIEKLIEKIQSNKNDILYKIRLSDNFIFSKSAISWLMKKIEKLNKNALVFEFSNDKLANKIKDCDYFIKYLINNNHKIIVEIVSFEKENLNNLEALKASFINVPKSYFIRDDNQIRSSIMSNISSTIGAQLIISDIEIKDDYTNLKKLKVKYMEGKYFV